MPRRVEDSRMLCLSIARTIKIAPQVKPGQRFEQNFLDRVVLRLDLPENLRVERRLLRHRRQSRRHEDLRAEKSFALLPVLEAAELRQRQMGVSGDDFSVARVLLRHMWTCWLTLCIQRSGYHDHRRQQSVEKCATAFGLRHGERKNNATSLRHAPAPTSFNHE